MLKCKATDKDDPTVDPRFGKVGKQTIEDTGALTKKRMETIDDETSAAAIDYMKRQKDAGKPFFCWWNAHSHAPAHARAGRASRQVQARRQRVHRRHDRARRPCRLLLKAVDDLGIANDTIVVYSTDNGPHMNSWPDGAMTHVPLGKEHQLGRRLPGALPGSLAGPHQARHRHERTHEPQRLDSRRSAPSLASRTSSASARRATTANGHTYKVHLDGYDQSASSSPPSRVPSARTTASKSARNKFFYSDDDGLLVGMRQGDYKYVFSEQRKKAHWVSGRNPSRRFVCRRFSTSCKTRSNGQTSRPTPIGTGSSTISAAPTV